MFERSKEKLVTAMATPELARTAVILGAVALIVAVLALGVALGKGPANAH